MDDAKKKILHNVEWYMCVHRMTCINIAECEQHKGGKQLTKGITYICI